MNKKGQSISINTIIVAAIALAVLVVLFAIFTGRMGLFTKTVQETDSCRQKCDSLGYTRFEDWTRETCSPERGIFISGKFNDASVNGCCCVK